MNIFDKVALQGLKNNRTRTLVTVIGVALSAALFTGIATFGTSLLAYIVDSEIAKGGNWHVMFSDVSFFEVEEWREDAEISETVSYENIGYAPLEGAGKQSEKRPYLFIAGFDRETYEKLPVSLVSGRLPESDSEILVPSDSIAAKAGVRISLKDVLTLAVGERENDGKILTQCDRFTEGEALVNTKEKTYTVVGTFEKPGFEVQSSAGYTCITKASGKEQTGHYSLYAALKNPRRVQAYAEEKSGVSAYEMNDALLRFMGITDNKIFNAFFYSIGGVVAVIVMVGSVFLIYNSFQISLNEHVHQYGILMSVGATAKQLCHSVLFEGLCIGILGIPLGILAGIGCIALLLPLVSKNFSNMIYSHETLQLAVSFPALLLSAGISLVTILISAYIPAKKAASVPVMECIRQTNEIKTDAKEVRIRKSAWKLYGLEGTLALKNFKRNKKRYRSIVLSLTLSVVLTVAGSSFGTSLKNIGGAYTAEVAAGDVFFLSDDMSEEEFLRFYDKLKGMEGIDRTTWMADYFYSGKTAELPADFLEMYRAATGESTLGKEQEMILYTQFIDDGIYYEFIENRGLPMEEYTGPDAKVLICGMDAEKHITYFAGSTMRFSVVSPPGEQEKEICATFEDDFPPVELAFEFDEDTPVYVFVMTAPMSMKPQFDGIRTVDGKVHLGALFWTESPTQVIRQVQKALMDDGLMADYRLYNLAQAFELWRNIAFVIDLFTYVFIFMISLIAVANVFNTISTNIRLRRRELAMLRSVGMSDKGFNRMMHFECAFYGIWTLLFGIPVSVALSYLIHYVINSIEETDAAFAFPWQAMCISVLGVFGIVFVTMVYATGKIRKENIIDALRDEMT